MVSDKDRAVVIEMCRTGMSLGVLKKCFPQFDGNDIEMLYNEHMANEQQRQKDGLSTDGNSISCNCS